MRNDEAIGIVKQGLNLQTDDHTVSEQYVLEVLKSVRAELIRQEANKEQLWNGGSAQFVNAFELQRSTLSESKDYQAATIVYKSVQPLPKLIDTKFGKIILGVYFDNGVKLQAVEYADWEATQKRRHKRPCAEPSYMLRNELLYILDYESGAPCIQVNIEGLFEDADSLKVNDCTYIGDLEFNVPGYLSRRIFDITVQTVARKYGITADTRNNGKDDTAQNQQR